MTTPAPSVDVKPREFYLSESVIDVYVVHCRFNDLSKVLFREVLPEQESEITALKAEKEKLKSMFEELQMHNTKHFCGVSDIKAENEKLKSALNVAKDALDNEEIELEICANSQQGGKFNIGANSILRRQVKINKELLQEISRIEGKKK